MSLIIFPAIDLRNGRVVRLRQGDPSAQTVFGDDPVETARRWQHAGAEWLHVVNLDAALGDADASAVNLRRLAEIRSATTVPIQFGGGLRTAEDVARVLELGATRVVLGTIAVRRPEVVRAILARFGPEPVVVGIDARAGRVATHGWQESSALDALAVACRVRDMGAGRVVYTDIARDGMLAGVDVAGTAGLARTSGLKVIASGGVASLDDLRELARHQADGIEGAIVGQALYSGAVDLREAVMVAQTC